MKGSIHLRSDVKMPYWYIAWYHAPEKKLYRIIKYLGENRPMHQTHPDMNRDLGYEKARKLLALMQGDVERNVFRIDKYIGQVYTDVIPYLNEWIEIRKESLKPAGYASYKRIIRNHLTPFFEEHPIQLHEIRYDTLVQLMNSITGSGKTKKNALDCLRSCLKFAWKSGRLESMPAFPEKKLFNIKQHAPEWLPTERFYNIVKHVPNEHKPFFMFLYLHLRRPGDAIALYKKDYDKSLDAFVIHRGISEGELIDSTKTGAVHVVPCHSEFKPYLEQLLKQNPFSPFLFTCEESKKDGKRYTKKIYLRQWHLARNAVGEMIDSYRGTKSTRAGQMLNELGLSLTDIQTAGDWSSLESVKAYARASVARKKEILEKKVVPIGASKKNGLT